MSLWMMDELIHGAKPYLLLLTTCGEPMSRMIEFWMKKHFIDDLHFNIVNPKNTRNDK